MPGRIYLGLAEVLKSERHSEGFTVTYLLGYRNDMLAAVEAMRQPQEIEITAMGDEERVILRHSWTPFRGWKTRTVRVPFDQREEA